MQKGFWIVLLMGVLAVSGFIVIMQLTENSKYKFSHGEGVIVHSTCNRFDNGWTEGVVDHIVIQANIDGTNETIREREIYYVSGIDACLYRVGDTVTLCVLHYNNEYLEAALVCNFKSYGEHIAIFTVGMFIVGAPFAAVALYFFGN